MIWLLLTLAGIALFDSLSMVPLAVIPMTVALGTQRPWASAGAFVGGIYLAYFLCGLVLLIGAEFLINAFGDYLDRLWNQPNAIELTLQIIIGLLFIASALYLRRPKPSGTPNDRPSPAASPAAMFVLGITLILIGIPGAVPYIAAIDQIIRFDASLLIDIPLLLFYNLLFVLPFLTLIALRFFFPQHAGPFFQKLANFAFRIMPPIVALLFLVAGLVMVADAVGWFFGYPLLPVAT